MTKTLEEFKYSIQQLEQEMLNSLTEGDGDERLFPICDGPLSVEDYYRSEIKILWILKEPYGKDNSWEDNSYASWYSTWKMNANYHFDNLTWRTIANSSYCILKNTFHDNLPSEVDVFNELGKIAWINIQKVPRNDNSSTNNADIKLAYEINSGLILRQIDACEPDIIICGGTFEIIGNDLQGEYQGTFGNADYYGSDGKVVIHAHHPAYWKVPRGIYANELVCAAETISSKSRLLKLKIVRKQIEQISIDLNLEINFASIIGYPDSLFYFTKPEWQELNIAIGFGFDNFFTDFFYGIRKINSEKRYDLKVVEDLKVHLGNSDGESTISWPWWKWDENRIWNDQLFENIENGNFVIRINKTLNGLIECFRIVGLK